MLKLIFGSKNIKYTCACCGYKSLTTNEMGEICCICFWEEGYDLQEDLFYISNTNHMTLYQAQENYKVFGCCNKKMLKHCRRPLSNETKDLNWQSIQDLIEKRYNESQLIVEIHKFCSILRQVDAEIIYKNFKSLNQIDIELNYDQLELNFTGFRDEVSFNKFKHELQLKSLLKALCNKTGIELLLKLFEEYYKNGLCYYISWSIMLFVLTSSKQLKLDAQITDIFLDIENNNYYGLAILKTALKEYWDRGEI